MKLKDADKKRKKWKITVILLCVLMGAAGAAAFYLHVYKVEPVFSEMVCEYGDAVSQDIGDYLEGTDWSVHLGELDLSRVDTAHTGTYQVFVNHGLKQFSYQVTIRDTIAPEILWRETQVYLAAGSACSVEDVIRGVEDADPETQVFFLRDDVTLSEICFEEVGKYQVEILARDRAGNETRGSVGVIVDTAPVLTGVHDFYCIPGSALNYREAVTARDDQDGDLTEYIVVDDSRVDQDRRGKYLLRYVVRDGYGLETVEEAQVLVASPEELQELIGQRLIDYRKDTIIGAPNIYDAGVSPREDMEETLEYMLPAIVQLYHATGRGGYSSGSGYIMEITEDTVYICSNSHVVEKYEDWEIFFYDGTSLPGKALGTSEIYDVGVAAVALEDVPEELLDRLMTVHIDMSYWESLDEQEIEVALERVDREGGLLHISKGNLIKARQEFDWYEKRVHTEVTVELVHGDSGSALMDGYGNLICMAYAYSTDPTRYWCIPLDGILDCYEEITGRRPYVY